MRPKPLKIVNTLGNLAPLKAGFRYGDMAPMAIIEFVDRDADAKGAADTARLEAEAAENS